MKNGGLYCWLLLLGFSQKLAAQPTQNYWHPGFSVGVGGGYALFTRPAQALPPTIPDGPFPSSGAVWTVLDANFTFRSRWGIRALGYKITARPYREDFRNSLEKSFPGYFLQDVSTDYIHTDGDAIFLGATFTKIYGRYFLQPAIMVGFVEFGYPGATAKAKAAGSNELYSLKFSPAPSSVWVQSPALLAGGKFGYLLSKRWRVYASFDGMAMKHRLKYDYSKTDEIEKKVETETLTFKSRQYSAAGQLGAAFLFGKLK